jgi:hypothetical protein
MFYMKLKNQAPPRGKSVRDRQSIDHYQYIFREWRKFVMPRKAVR